MTTRLKALLEEAIQKFCDDHAEDADWPIAYWPEAQVPRMATAAYSVWMASVDGQEYAEMEREP